MRIAQLLTDGASDFERRMASVDAAALSTAHALVTPDQAEIVHVYGPAVLPAGAVRSIRVPYVASGAPLQSRWSFREVLQPRAKIAPWKREGFEYVPESVPDEFFADHRSRSGTEKRVGSFGRRSVLPVVEQTYARIRRLRDDVEWIVFERSPTLHDLRAIDAWIDPAIDVEDYDGFTAEALVSGLPVVASRTPVNTHRLEKGRSGFLVPPGDANEMTHAILAALFKPESAGTKKDAARQTASRFAVRHRVKALERVYENALR